MRLRTGGPNGVCLYIQLGDEPSEDDEYIAYFFDPKRAERVAEIVSEHWNG